MTWLKFQMMPNDVIFRTWNRFQWIFCRRKLLFGCWFCKKYRFFAIFCPKKYLTSELSLRFETRYIIFWSAHGTSFKIFIPIGFMGFLSKTPTNHKKWSKKTFFLGLENRFFLDFATWNGDEYFHFSSKETLSRQKVYPHMPRRYQIIDNDQG